MLRCSNNIKKKGEKHCIERPEEIQVAYVQPVNFLTHSNSVQIGRDSDQGEERCTGKNGPGGGRVGGKKRGKEQERRREAGREREDLQSSKG